MHPITMHPITTECCHIMPYRDNEDGGWYCSACDRAVDSDTGRALTERERDAAARLHDEATR